MFKLNLCEPVQKALLPVVLTILLRKCKSLPSLQTHGDLENMENGPS